MNSVVRRALVLRVALALCAYAVIVGFGALSSPHPPWLSFLGFFGVVLTFYVVTSLFADRRLDVRAGKGDAPWTGSGASWTQQISLSPIEAGPGVATRAIANVGGRNVELLNGSAAVGWIGSRWVNIPEWQEYQLAVVVAPWGTGTSFTCCARPRWKMNWGGLSKSRRLVESLRAEVEKLDFPAT